MPYQIFAIGNPLLDMSVTNGEEILKKYELKANDAVLAEEKQMAIYDDVVSNYDVTYVAGGAAQNAARGAAYILPPKSVVYVGSVGDDSLAEQLKAANAREGLDQVYYVNKGEKTGACAVIVTGHNRSLCTTLRSAEKFNKSHLESPEVAPLIDEAKFFYIEGYFITHGMESINYLGSKAASASKTVVLNFSAPFIPQFFKDNLQTVLSYTDIAIMNEAEAAAWGEANGVAEPHNLPSVGKAIAAHLKSNSAQPRMVVITHGAESTIVVKAEDPDNFKTYGVHALTDDQIVDTNGAGDAFAGGFMGAYALGKDLDVCVEAGHKMGSMCVQLTGPTYTWPKVQVV